MREDTIVTGDIRGVIVRFALPMLTASMLQALYGAVDLFVVGRFSTAGAVSAVSLGSQVMLTLTGIILGISTGGTVLLGRRMGERNPEGAAHAVGTVATLFLLLALLLTPPMLAGTNLWVDLLHTPPEAVEETRHYLFCCGAGLPFIVGYNAVSGIFRGMGDSRTPVRFITLACVINVVGDFVLVGQLGLSARGAALATVLAQGISFLVSLVYLLRKGFPFPFNARHFRLHGGSARAILQVGLPLALQDALVNVSFLVIAAIINSFGVVASAAAGVVDKLLGFVFLMPSAISGAVATITAHNLGAGKPERARQAMRWGMVYSLLLTGTVVVLLELFPRAAAGIFTTDAAVVEGAVQYMRVYCLDTLLVSFVFNLNGYFSGCQNSLISAVHSLIATFCIRIPLSWALSRLPGMTLLGLGIVPPLSTLVSVMIAGSYYFYTENKKRRNEYA